jgi:hypothetical protein
MITLEQIKEAYPPWSGGEDKFSHASNYYPILQMIGEIILKVDDDEYQGDSRVIYKRGGKEYGLLIFGWGSCSGCDALQSCDSWEEVHDLAKSLEAKTQWFSLDGIIEYFEKHDWEGDYSGHQDETKQFIEEGKKLLKELKA